jgi:catecholate siderophore receptor
MRCLPSFVVVCLLPLFAHAPAAAAQSAGETFYLTGKALDATHASIPNARVTAVPDNPGSPRSTVTDAAGSFRLAVPAGRYSVTIAADGFRDASRTVSVPLAGGGLEVVLQVAGIHETAAVTAALGYEVPAIRTATKTLTPLRDVPQSVTVVTQELIHDQLMTSMGDVMRYVPGVAVHQGENNRDQVVMRGNSTTADFFVDGVRDDVPYYRDLYNLSRVEVLKGPNALMFGRGGAGGVVNRVGKEALFQPLGEVSLQSGMYGNKRFTADVDRPLSGTVAVRVNGIFEDSDSFRHGVGLRRYGVTPTLTFAPTSRTSIVASYEYLNDTRVADRGVSSYHGRPVDVHPSTYYGNPDESHVAADVNRGAVTIEHRAGAVTLRNHTSIAAYDRWYQNFVPGTVSADRSQVTLTAYNNATNRTNLFNQTDLTYAAMTGRVRHTMLVGAEVGRQLTDNLRNTGFFNNAATSISVPFTATTVTTPVTFRQSATDADNHLRTNLAAAYAQDQIALTSHLQVVGGLRVDRFDLQYHNNRSGADLERQDNLVSPRAGVIVTPVTPLSVYGSYSVSYLPSSGDQFSLLTSITQQLKPEKFNGYEAGVKWEVRPGLAVTTAVYRLDRSNTRSTDPNDPARIVQTGSQRTNGYELGFNGGLTRAWSIAGGYAYQDAFVSAATAAAAAGRQVGQVPHHTLSLWNHYRVNARVSAGLGILHRSDMFAAVDNAVTLPGYTRADAAVYYTLAGRTRVQVNVENLFDATYFLNADGNTNISPGSPRSLRIGLTIGF